MYLTYSHQLTATEQANLGLELLKLFMQLILSVAQMLFEVCDTSDKPDISMDSND